LKNKDEFVLIGRIAHLIDAARAISSQVGEIEHRLQAIQRGLEKLGGRASSSARESADGLSEAVASALSNWAGRARGQTRWAAGRANPRRCSITGTAGRA
jgi:hypothetical protein